MPSKTRYEMQEGYRDASLGWEQQAYVATTEVVVKSPSASIAGHWKR